VVGAACRVGAAGLGVIWRGTPNDRPPPKRAASASSTTKPKVTNEKNKTNSRFFIDHSMWKKSDSD
jgi:hypothetical protein